MVGWSVTDAGGPLQLYSDVRRGVYLSADVTDHVMADDCHVGGETAKSYERRTVDR